MLLSYISYIYHYHNPLQLVYWNVYNQFAKPYTTINSISPQPSPTSHLCQRTHSTLLSKPQRIPRWSLPPSLPSPTHHRLSSANSIPSCPQRILRRLASGARSFRRIFDTVAIVARPVAPAVGRVGYSAQPGWVSGARTAGCGHWGRGG